MIPEMTILKLQTAAAILMGYDYFISESLKEKANAVAENVIKTYQSQQDEKLKNQLGIFLTWIPRLFSGGVYAVSGWAIYLFAKVLTAKDSPQELQIFGITLLILVIYCVVRATKQLMDVFSNGLIPFTLPAISRIVTTFLLYSSKGTIAAFGMLCLMASFLCRYSNAGAF